MGEKLPQGDIARIVERQVNAMDRHALDELYAGVGSLAYDPLMLLKMVLYQYLKGRRSPATWFEEAKLNEAMQWLGRGYTPARRTWYDFRDRVGGVVDRLHKQMIQTAIDSNLLDPVIAAQDGTSVAACASRHQMINKGTLERRKQLLGQIIDGKYPLSEPLPRWIPPTEIGRRDLAQRMEYAEHILDERIRKNAAKTGKKRKDASKIYVSLTDPDAPLGRDKMKVFRPLYTIQIVMDQSSRIVMSYCCDAVVTDSGTLLPMIDQTQELVGGRVKTILADSAYCSALDLLGCEARGIHLLGPLQSNSFTEKKKQAKTNQQIPREQFRFDAAQNCYECPAGHKLAYTGRERKQRHGGQSIWQFRYRCAAVHCGNCPLAQQCLRSGSSSRTIKRLKDQDIMDAHRAKMADPDLMKLYSQRCQTVEWGFADARAHRGLQRFHGRGLDRARTETGLLVVAQNLLRIDKLMHRAINPVNIPT
ncbi:MAG: IS1182 family transposase [Planctomyces sp.]